MSNLPSYKSEDQDPPSYKSRPTKDLSPRSSVNEPPPYRSRDAMPDYHETLPGECKFRTGEPIYIHILLDSSTSMDCRTEGVIKHFNEFVTEQKNTGSKDDRCTVWTFNSRIDRSRGTKPFSEIPLLTEKNYVLDDGTALYNTIVETFKDGEKKIVVAITDGFDCLSLSDAELLGGKETRESAARAIEEAKKRGCEFLMVGVGPNAKEIEEVGSSLGGSSCSSSVENEEGVQPMSTVLSSAVEGFRKLKISI